MAESVDALVSNTSGATRAGSTPALGTSCDSKAIAKPLHTKDLAIFLFLRFPTFSPHLQGIAQSEPPFPHQNSCKVSPVFPTRKARIWDEW